MFSAEVPGAWFEQVFYDGLVADPALLYDTGPRLVWIWRNNAAHSGAALPAWPGLLLAWRRTAPEPPAPARWQALVAFSRSGELEVRWFYDSELAPVAEQPPVR
jgi:hypothetical protein